MKKALIEGARVAQVEPINTDPKSEGIPFPVAAPLVWVDCPDDVKPNTHTFDGKAVVANPLPPEQTFEEKVKTQIAAIETGSRITDRGARELALYQPAARNIADKQVNDLCLAIRFLASKLPADQRTITNTDGQAVDITAFDVVRIPDIGKNKGMVDLATAEAAIVPLRQQLAPK